ncbi:hypothetical protein GCM10010156_73420 [Planobispora rosea]|uniref:Uncharacterized protein n=1 Tax=Planobispora rosea TaxID=35762 RepID=A0A8J3WG41_PLARO|nr:hypothetical protein GCM10010156_73420 [Planobispora rosea]GIH88849.1 hypothetical protein Pro02_72570 [Planobispora rosea]
MASQADTGRSSPAIARRPAAGCRAGTLGALTLDAWTRDDPGTLRWYRTNGFAESEHYLHVYANHYTEPGEPVRAIGERRPGLSCRSSEARSSSSATDASADLHILTCGR